MRDEEADFRVIGLIISLVLITGRIVGGEESLETDKEVLGSLKKFLEHNNLVNRGVYREWNLHNRNPCGWPGIGCSNAEPQRVISVNLSDNNISGEIFQNFSALTKLSHLDLSKNTLGGRIPADLSRCGSLVYLNLSHNIIDGELNLTGLKSLEILDISINRIGGKIQSTFPAVCDRLVVANISENNFTGTIDNCFEDCKSLKYLDLSSNNFSGEIWQGFTRLQTFTASENMFHGVLSSSIFGVGGVCSLIMLDLSKNHLWGEVPGEIANCRSLRILNLWGNEFTGPIPPEIGSLSDLEGLFLGSNEFSRQVPESLLNLSNLAFLDLSRNNFGGDIQEIFGKFKRVRYLVLHANSYTGGIHSSGILKLSNVSRLDLSYNNFSGPLPVEFSEMPSLEFLILAYNNFSGSIPSEFGNFRRLQALDLSYNNLNGSIPNSIGKLKSLLWLMLADNRFSGEIPAEIGNCTSLLWLNLANNRFSGKIPPQVTTIGRNPFPTFEMNKKNTGIFAGSGECLAMRRWIPADYPPFSFVYTLLSRKSCRNLWDNLLKGHGVFPMCLTGSKVRTLQISGYLQISGNQFSGELPPQIRNMQNFSLIQMGDNKLYGKLPPEIGQLPVVVLNLSENRFSGEIPSEIGNLRCLQSLDLSCNNFSGTFPTTLNNLSELNKFNISYNPLISGVIPSTGQLTTFEKESFLGDPLLLLPSFIGNGNHHPPPPVPVGAKSDGKPKQKKTSVFVLITLTLAFIVCGLVSLLVCILWKGQGESAGYLLEGSEVEDSSKYGQGQGSEALSSPWSSGTVKVIRLDKTAFTHADILKATCNFSESRIIGKGGFGTVYRGVLPDGREVAVKKLQRDGIEGEKEFRSEMEVLSGKGNGFGWPHPNLVTLYGWCLNGSEKLLVYEYMEGGSLEDMIGDRTRLTWRRRLDVAIDVARALVFLHHECFTTIVHRDVKASNVLLGRNGKARVTDFGLARVVDAGNSHVSTMVAGTVGYVAPEYGQTGKATTKGDVYSFGVLAMELATGRHAVDGGDECLVEWGRRVMLMMGGNVIGSRGSTRWGLVIPVVMLGSGLAEGAEEMCELLRIGIKCTQESPQARPNMKEVLAMLIKILSFQQDLDFSYGSSPPSVSGLET